MFRHFLDLLWGTGTAGEEEDAGQDETGWFYKIVGEHAQFGPLSAQEMETMFKLERHRFDDAVLVGRARQEMKPLRRWPEWAHLFPVVSAEHAQRVGQFWTREENVYVPADMTRICASFARTMVVQIRIHVVEGLLPAYVRYDWEARQKVDVKIAVDAHTTVLEMVQQAKDELCAKSGVRFGHFKHIFDTAAIDARFLFGGAQLEESQKLQDLNFDEKRDMFILRVDDSMSRFTS